METSYRAYYVGPAPSDQLDAAIAACGSNSADTLMDRRGMWATVEVRRFADAIVATLGPGVWLWEVELQNDLEDDADSHSGTIRGWQCKKGGELQLRSEAELWEEGYLRGGVMAECAFEYMGWYHQQELDAAVAAAPDIGPSTPVGPRVRKRKKT